MEMRAQVMMPKYSQIQSMGRKTVEFRIMARTVRLAPDRSWAVLAWRSKITPFCPPSEDTRTVRRVLLYWALTPRLNPRSRLDSMV